MVNPDTQLALSVIVNFVNFFVFITAPYALFYFAREMDLKKNISLSIFLLALGLNFIGLSYLIRIFSGEVAPQYVLGSLSIGALLILASVISFFSTKALEFSLLRERHKKIKAVILDLQKKYYKKEISEDVLREVYGELLKELADIEFKLKKGK